MAKKPATKETSTGICNFCQGEFEKGRMTQHLKFCKQRIAALDAEAQSSSTKSRKPKKTKLFHLVVEGRYLPMYWMHLEMPASATLWDLDHFLRGIWLECCGHLSAFRIGKVSYSSDAGGEWGFGDMMVESDTVSTEDSLEANDDLPPNVLPLSRKQKPTEDIAKPISPLSPNVPPVPEDSLLGAIQSIAQGNIPGDIPPEIAQLIQSLMSSPLVNMFEEHDMDIELAKVLKPGMKFTHEYDFGSTTELSLRVVAEREGVVRGKKDTVQILARNLPPVIPCRECGKPATKIIAGYYSVGDSAICDDCVRRLRDGDSNEADATPLDIEEDELDEEEFDEEDDDEEFEEYFDEGMLLPIVNSPRVGVCGYTGRD